MHKQYSRLKHVALPDVSKSVEEPRGLIKKRASFRDFSEKPIDKATLSEILYYSSSVIRPNPFDNDNPYRAYPSAGAKYPLEIYPLVLFGKDIDPGLYHYSPIMHNLEVLSQSIKKEEISAIWIKEQSWFKKAAVLLIITSTFHRTTDKYGERGVMFPYIEAGHLAQNVYLIATSLGIGCCAIGMLNDNFVIKLLDINSREEYPIYYLALGT